MTCLAASDTERLQQALDAPLGAMSTPTAGLFPEFEQLEAFAGAQLEDNFHSILTRCADVSLTPLPMHAMCGAYGSLTTQLTHASMLNKQLIGIAGVAEDWQLPILCCSILTEGGLLAQLCSGGADRRHVHVLQAGVGHTGRQVPGQRQRPLPPGVPAVSFFGHLLHSVKH